MCCKKPLDMLTEAYLDCFEDKVVDEANERITGIGNLNKNNYKLNTSNKR